MHDASVVGSKLARNYVRIPGMFVIFCGESGVTRNGLRI